MLERQPSGSGASGLCGGTCDRCSSLLLSCSKAAFQPGGTPCLRPAAAPREAPAFPGPGAGDVGERLRFRLQLGGRGVFRGRRRRQGGGGGVAAAQQQRQRPRHSEERCSRLVQAPDPRRHGLRAEQLEQVVAEVDAVGMYERVSSAGPLWDDIMSDQLPHLRVPQRSSAEVHRLPVDVHRVSPGIAAPTDAAIVRVGLPVEAPLVPVDLHGGVEGP
mmetsp:Transcript_121168/g.354130  ORF Transcript_121168/g.354130 Transcript_121168/m.354130 type:complete len:217 (-) Transcript_121168:703-1353(-)